MIISDVVAWSMWDFFGHFSVIFESHCSGHFVVLKSLFGHFSGPLWVFHCRFLTARQQALKVCFFTEWFITFLHGLKSQNTLCFLFYLVLSAWFFYTFSKSDARFTHRGILDLFWSLLSVLSTLLTLYKYFLDIFVPFGLFWAF